MIEVRLGHSQETNRQAMKIADFDYHLPPAQIAQAPLAEREASRMLLLDRSSGAWEDRQFRELPALLRGDELMVVNNTRVLPARLFGRRAGLHAEHHTARPPMHPADHGEQQVSEVRPPSDASTAEPRGEFLSSRIEVLLVRPLEAAFWEALVRPGRKVPVGETIIFGDGELQAKVEWRGEFGLRRLRFSPAEAFEREVRRLGHVPLPPYIRRPDEPSDRERYQTVYAQQAQARAVAAPTAGLHFTLPVLNQIRARGVEIVEITLEVGLGTFEPVRTEILEDHPIHREAYEISEAAAQAIATARQNNRPILAVGTTVVRALEDAASRGGEIRAGRVDAEIFLYPGKTFRVVSQLLTNFHLPQSTLLALVAGFAGRERVLAAYRHAVESGYRFYSFGDCMWIR
jgi:S-adenosylmethionine:tRNA ribosyltransferase-isomerase